LKGGLESILEKKEQLFKIIWKKEVIPEEWRRRKIIIMLPQKGHVTMWYLERYNNTISSRKYIY